MPTEEDIQMLREIRDELARVREEIRALKGRLMELESKPDPFRPIGPPPGIPLVKQAPRPPWELERIIKTT